MNTAIKANGLIKKFAERTVLDGIDLSIGRGEIFGLLGPSGAGKTTLIRLLTGQLTPDGGECEINGKSSLELRGEDLRSYGIMMDDFGVYERLSCFENLMIFARIYGLGREAALDALHKVGLAEAAKRPAHKLSKGMKSRLRLARAFMTDPDILFLDEPTSGLDPATAQEIHSMIIAQKQLGKTVFLTTHNMTEAYKLCDGIALLCDGHIIERGAPQEICRRYDHQKRLRIHLTDGTDRELAHEPQSAAQLAELLAGGMVQTIHSTEPDLETVFMELTGKELAV